MKKHLKTTKRGQGMTEYIIIVSLIAIGTIGTITLFGDNLRLLFASAAEALAGNASVAGASGNLGKGESKDLVAKSMKTFGKHNDYR